MGREEREFEYERGTVRDQQQQIRLLQSRIAELENSVRAIIDRPSATQPSGARLALTEMQDTEFLQNAGQLPKPTSPGVGEVLPGVIDVDETIITDGVTESVLRPEVISDPIDGRWKFFAVYAA